MVVHESGFSGKSGITSEMKSSVVTEARPSLVHVIKRVTRDINKMDATARNLMVFLNIGLLSPNVKERNSIHKISPFGLARRSDRNYLESK